MSIALNKYYGLYTHSDGELLRETACAHLTNILQPLISNNIDDLCLQLNMS